MICPEILSLCIVVMCHDVLDHGIIYSEGINMVIEGKMTHPQCNLYPGKVSWQSFHMCSEKYSVNPIHIKRMVYP